MAWISRSFSLAVEQPADLAGGGWLCLHHENRGEGRVDVS
jgi:hypothetical protein